MEGKPHDSTAPDPRFFFLYRSIPDGNSYLDVTTSEAKLNTYSLTDANLAKIEKDFADAKAGGWTTVRILVTPAEMFSGGAIHFDLLDKLKAIRTKYGRKICSLYYCDLAAQGFWINQITDSQAEADQVYANWGPNKSWKVPEGLPQELEQPFIDACVEIDQYLKPDYKQVENEPGATLDSMRDEWSDVPMGFVPPAFKRFANRLADALAGTSPICSTPWETQTMEGLLEQVDSGAGVWLRKCQINSINWYLTPWVKGDTPESWAARCWADIIHYRDKILMHKNPLCVSEVNAIGVPPELEMPALLALKRTKPSTIKFVTPYLWERA